MKEQQLDEELLVEFFTNEKTVVITWLMKRPFIWISKLEKHCGIPRQTLQKAIDGVRPLPDKYLKKLINELKNYGYVPKKVK